MDESDFWIRIVFIIKLVRQVDKDGCQSQRIDTRIELVKVSPETAARRSGMTSSTSDRIQMRYAISYLGS
jgi:hypothetical protein